MKDTIVIQRLCLSPSSKLLLFFFKFIYFEREKENESASGGWVETENPKQASHRQYRTQHRAGTHEP